MRGGRFSWLKSLAYSRRFTDTHTMSEIENYTEFNKALVVKGKTVIQKLGLGDLVRISNWSGSEDLWLVSLTKHRKLIKRKYGVERDLSFQIGGRDVGLKELESITNFKLLKSKKRISHSLEEEKAKLESNIRAVFASSGNLGDFIRLHSTPPENDFPLKGSLTERIIEIPTTSFVAAYDDLCARYRQRYDEDFEDFNTGVAYTEESYKVFVRQRGWEILKSAKWGHKHIGTGRIASTIREIIEINEGKGFRNNMVQWEAKQGPMSRSHRRILDAMDDPARLEKLESALFALYCTDQDEAQVFTDLVGVVGARYDVLAYLFYVKDPTRFLPISPTNFEKAFRQLGVPLQLSGLCSWENYQDYIARIRATQRRLTVFGHPGCQLIDAHSFCWMLAKIPSVKDVEPTIDPVRLTGTVQPAPSKIPPTNENTSITIKTPEDYLNEQMRRNQIGMKAEAIVINAEIAELKAAGREDLACKVKDVSRKVGLGYDIESFTIDGNPKRIEVKSASEAKDVWQFYLSENELDKATRIDGYVFALVRNPESQPPKIWEFDGHSIKNATLRPTNYHVSIVRVE